LSQEPVIRPAGEADKPLLAEMLVLTLQTQPQFRDRPAADLQALAGFELAGWQIGRDFAFVAWLGEEKAGAVWLNGGGEIGGKTFTLGLAVLPQHRSQGIGTRLMEHALQFCAENRTLSLDLKVHPTNEKAIRLYRRFGFEPTMLEMKKRF
jgi:ribosomal protein S18 acetylase RimI-like enzyme